MNWQFKPSKHVKWAVQLLVLALAGYFIYHKLSNPNLQSTLINTKVEASVLGILALLIAWFFNFYLEILLWQNTLKPQFKISKLQAFTDNLVFQAYAFISPANTGGFVARITRFKTAENRKLAASKSAQLGIIRYIARVLIGGTCTLILLLSAIGLALPIALLVSSVAVVLFLVILGFQQNIKIKLPRFLQHLFPSAPQAKANLPQLLLIATLRFLTYNIQFGIILSFLNVPVNADMLLNIPAFYFISTLVPILPAFDFVVKGAVGMAFFTYFDDIPNALLITTTALWFMNWALPSLAGAVVRRKRID